MPQIYTPTQGSNPYNGTHLVTLSTGEMYCCFMSVANDIIYIGYSNNDGATWTFSIANYTYPAYSHYLCMCSDSNDKIYLFYSEVDAGVTGRYNTIYLTKAYGGVWTVGGYLFASITQTFLPMACDVDASDRVHLVGYSLDYLETWAYYWNSDMGWAIVNLATLERIPAGTTSLACEVNLWVEDNGDSHVCGPISVDSTPPYRIGMGYVKRTYLTSVWGSLVTIEASSCSDGCSWNDILVDGSNIGILYTVATLPSPFTSGKCKLAICLSGVWQAPVLLSANMEDSFCVNMELDAEGHIWLVYGTLDYDGVNGDLVARVIKNGIYYPLLVDPPVFIDDYWGVTTFMTHSYRSLYQPSGKQQMITSQTSALYFYEAPCPAPAPPSKKCPSNQQLLRYILSKRK